MRGEGGGAKNLPFFVSIVFFLVSPFSFVEQNFFGDDPSQQLLWHQ